MNYGLKEQKDMLQVVGSGSFRQWGVEVRFSQHKALVNYYLTIDFNLIQVLLDS